MSVGPMGGCYSRISGLTSSKERFRSRGNPELRTIFLHLKLPDENITFLSSSTALQMVKSSSSIIVLHSSRSRAHLLKSSPTLFCHLALGLPLLVLLLTPGSPIHRCLEYAAGMYSLHMTQPTDPNCLDNIGYIRFSIVPRGLNLSVFSCDLSRLLVHISWATPFSLTVVTFLRPWLSRSEFYTICHGGSDHYFIE